MLLRFRVPPIFLLLLGIAFCTLTFYLMERPESPPQLLISLLATVGVVLVAVEISLMEARAEMKKAEKRRMEAVKMKRRSTD